MIYPPPRGGVDDLMAASDPVGPLEVADRLGVLPQTVRVWRTRNVLPPPRWVISRVPIWTWESDIEPWARETGRLTGDHDGK